MSNLENREELIEKLSKLGALSELIYKCKELIQGEGLVGGHRGYADDCLSDISNEIYDELEQLKEML